LSKKWKVSHTIINRTERIHFLVPPISTEEFMKGKVIDGSSKIVLDFLKAHQDQAFTQDEIIDAVGSHPVSPESIMHFLAAMAPLQLQGLVERRLIISTDKDSELYYRAIY
jgi:hypothetical protein